MQKPNFRNVSLDLYTYNQLSGLAKAAKLTRTEFLRHLIRAQIDGEGMQPALAVSGFKMPEAQYVTDAKAQAAMAGVEIVFQHGMVKALSDLPLIQRTATRMAKKYGITIDTQKWIREFVASLSIRQNPEKTLDEQPL